MHKKSFRAIYSFILILLLLSSTVFSQDKIQHAYKELGAGKIKKAEKLFLKLSHGNYRADLGLAFCYTLQDNKEKSREYYDMATQEADKPEPYILAGSITGTQLRPDTLLIKLLKKETENKEDGSINAIACENLGQFYLAHNNIDKAKYYFDKMGAVKDWSVIGPFENISSSGFYQKYPPEIKFDPKANYSGKNNMPVHWFNIDKYRIDDWIDFTLYFANENSIFYANTYVYSPKKQDIQFRLGTSGSYRAFLNDHLISECYDERNNDLDTYVIATTLRKGWNKILLKVGYSSINRCNFLLRLTDDKGFPLKNLKFSTAKKDYTPVKNEKAVPIVLPNENYFVQKIKQHPDYPENYALLAEVYLRNDKMNAAEQLLKNGLKIMPKNILLMYELLSVYNKDGRTTERNTINNKINSINDSLPAILSVKISKAMQNKNVESLKTLLAKIIPLLPDSPELYAFKVGYYSLKNIPAKVIKIINEAYEKYPDFWTIVKLKANLEYSVSRDYGKTAAIIEKYCINNYSYSALKELSNIYLSTSKVNQWDSTYSINIIHDPAAPGYYYQKAKVFYSLQKYDKAKSAVEEALHICPFNSSYYKMLGDIYAAENKNTDAKKSYLNSLKYSSTNYEAREKLKNLEESDSTDKDIKAFDIKALIADAPGTNKYPDEDAVVLLKDEKRTFYKGGASELDKQILIKILNKDGISDFTNYSIDYNPNDQDLIFDKAVVVKKDGSEIDADKDNGDLVFKSLNVNDCIYIKYKIRNYYSGELADHFWDSFNFNMFFPVENIRYSLVMPADKKVYYRGHNMSSDPMVKKNLGKNILYIWQKKDLPAINYESGMPPLDDAGMVLYVSTIKNWNFISRWYLNLSASKIRSNFVVKEKVDKLLKGKESLPVKDKVRIIYDYIVQNITYSSVPFRQSALIPQKARDVLVSKIGDCKDMATLFIAMLKEIGIKAHYILVCTNDNGTEKDALPGDYFNHVIAKVVLGGKPLLLDLTARNYPFGTLPYMDIGAFALEVSNNSDSPFYIEDNNLTKNEITRNTDIVINKDNSVLIDVKTKRSGACTSIIRDIYNDIDAKVRLKKMNEILSNSFSNYKVTSFSSGNLDSLTSTLDYDYTFKLNRYLSPVGSYKLLKMPWEDKASSELAFSYESRKYQYNLRNHVFRNEETMNIKFPAEWKPLEVPKNVNLDCKSASYSVTYKYSGNTLTAKRIFINKVNVVTPDEYKGYKDFMNKVIASDRTQILLKGS